MTNKSPIFPIHEPHHFSDYGFDPQIDYFQVLEEARNHKLQHPSSSRSAIDNLHFKLQKPNSKDESSKKIKKTRNKRWWWKNALRFFKRKCTTAAGCGGGDDYPPPSYVYGGGGVRALSGPVYLAESRSGASTPYRRSSASRPSSGPLAGTTFNIPYISLTELNIDPTRKISGSAMPIYLVT